MVFGGAVFTMASHIYNALGAFVRYLFVKSSLQTDVQETIKGDTFKLYCILGPQVIKVSQILADFDTLITFLVFVMYPPI